MDAYDPATVFSSIDTQGSYAYGNQPHIAAWNLARFAETLLPLLHDNEEQAVKIAQDAISDFADIFHTKWLAGMRVKLGIFNEAPEDQSLIEGLLAAERQTMLFSATIPPSIRNLAKRYMKNPVNIQIESKTITLDEIRQEVVPTTDRQKQDTLFKLIDDCRPYLALVFCRTKRRAALVNEALLAHGYLSDELHGDLSQAKRERVMRRFREAKLQILVATDVAARGIDVEGITHVFNYDIPEDTDSYIHRIGRTGRAGEKGLAITLATPRDSALFTELSPVYIAKNNRIQSGESRRQKDNKKTHLVSNSNQLTTLCQSPPVFL